MPKINLITKKKVDTKSIYIMSRQVSVMLSSGINVVSAFEMLLSQKNSKSMTRALRSVVKDIQSGGSLHSSIEKTGYFPDAFTSMVMIGENSGNLDNVFMRLSEYYYKEYKTKHTIRQAMAYPIFILVVTFIAAILMATTILPMIANMIKGLEIGELPLPTKILMNINLYLSNRIFLIVMAFGMCFLGVFIHMKKDMIIQKIGFKIPIINSMYKKIVTAKFARSLSMLFSSGIPIIEALALCEVLLGRVYIKYMREIKDRVESGDSLYLAINGSTIFPEFFSNMIETGEESGRLDFVLNKIADFYEKEIEFSLKKVTKIFEPTLIIGLSIVVGFLLSAVMLPLFQIYGEI